MKNYFIMFFTFFKIGLFTFGGGYSMLPLLEREIVDKHGWATMEELTNYFAISQCTPGVIAVNTATFIGNKKLGVFGGIICTLGVVIPSILVILLVANFLSFFSASKNINHALAGINIAVSVLMTNSIYKMFKVNVKNKISISLFISAFLMAYFAKIPTVFLVIIFAILGLIICVLVPSFTNHKTSDDKNERNRENGGDKNGY